MKSIFIVFNQALSENVIKMLEKNNIRGFTQWDDVKGRGSHKGEPHMGTHTWPALNSAIMTITEASEVDKVLNGVKAINEKAEKQGIRAFVWDVESTV